MNKKLPASNSPPVKKAPSGKVLTVPKKPLPRSSVVGRARSNLRGVEDVDDVPIFLSSDYDKAEKKVCYSSSSEGMALTMLQEAESFFNLPWKDYVSVYIIFITCFCKLFLICFYKRFCNCFYIMFSKPFSSHH